MADAYGNAFVNQYGEEPNPSWVAGLSVFNDEQIRLGYEKAILDNREFVPNLSVLINYIAGNNDWEHKRYKPSHEALNASIVDLGEGRLLEGPKDELTPEEYIAQMRKEVGV